ncbi:hypothetical protein [Vallitalea okinawensis]|uniref:hypothetical protein n=1 Tax=Vallitalea okinawensis TaxID=2078660 RepID=UPI000CFCD2C6|nr:hypothetical protein [Vallitalea okinawensis]
MKKLRMYLLVLTLLLLILIGCTSEMGDEVNLKVNENSKIEQSEVKLEVEKKTVDTEVEEDDFVIDYEEVENIIYDYLNAQLKRDYEKMAEMLWKESYVAFGFDDPYEAMKAQEREHIENNYEMVSFIMGDMSEEESEFYPNTKFVGGHFEERRFLNGQEYVLEYNYIRLAFDDELGWRVCYKKYLGIKELDYDQSDINYATEGHVPKIKIALDKILYNNHEAYFILNIMVHEEEGIEGLLFSSDEDHQTTLVIDTTKYDWKGIVPTSTLTQGSNQIIVPVQSFLNRYIIESIRIEDVYYQSQDNSEPIPFDFIIFDEGEYVTDQLIQSN